MFLAGLQPFQLSCVDALESTLNNGNLSVCGQSMVVTQFFFLLYICVVDVVGH